MWATEFRVCAITNLRLFTRRSHHFHRPQPNTTRRIFTKATLYSSIPPPNTQNKNITTTSTSNDTTSSSSTQPTLPLCERKPRHTSNLSSLLAFQREALLRVSFVGDAWAVEDDGPSQQDLETELSWLLDDAVAGVVDETGAPQRGLTWRNIERELKMGTLMLTDNATVQLREPLQHLDTLWKQRLDDRVPLQYLISAAYWRDYILSVGPGVLIPRPETELIIDFVTDAINTNQKLAQGAWADLGTGSGALAIGIAKTIPTIPVVWAVDAAAAPAVHASFNAQRLAVADRVKVVRGSWYEPLRAAGVSQLAGIVSNPPYIPAEVMDALQAEVGRHEPHLALNGGRGIAVDCLTPICEGAAELLQSGGFLALETNGGDQAEFIASNLRVMKDGRVFRDVEIRKDLRGVDRFVTAIKM